MTCVIEKKMLAKLRSSGVGLYWKNELSKLTIRRQEVKNQRKLFLLGTIREKEFKGEQQKLLIFG